MVKITNLAAVRGVAIREFPPATMCIHSTWSTKFSYMRSVRISQIGTPVEVIIPSRTPKVSGAQLMFTQPFSDVPSKSGGSFACTTRSLTLSTYSSTVTMSSTCAWMSANVRSPGRTASRPSATPAAPGTVTIGPWVIDSELKVYYLMVGLVLACTAVPDGS